MIWKNCVSLWQDVWKNTTFPGKIGLMVKWKKKHFHCWPPVGNPCSVDSSLPHLGPVAAQPICHFSASFRHYLPHTHFCQLRIFLLLTFHLDSKQWGHLGSNSDGGGILAVLRCGSTWASICCVCTPKAVCFSSECGGCGPCGLWTQTNKRKGLHSWARSWGIVSRLGMREL